MSIPSGKYLNVDIGKYYISQCEVTNREYKEFLNYLKSKKMFKELEVAQVYSTFWKEFCLGDCTLDRLYFYHYAFDHYPVVNISKEAATLYCKWLSEKYNKKSSKKYIVRLPTEIEWMYAASCGGEKFVYGNCSNNLKTEKIKNENEEQYFVNGWFIDNNKASDGCWYMCSVRKYNKNAFNLYNMSGNVSELIYDKNITKGGSWNDSDEFLKLTSFKEYNTPTPYIGFRFVVIEK